MDFLMRIPFSNGKSLSLGALSIPVFFFVVIGTVNGVNLTDGLDGLAASVTLMVAMLWLIISIGKIHSVYRSNHNKEMCIRDSSTTMPSLSKDM